MQAHLVRVLKGLVIALAAIALLVLVLAAGLWWWAGTPASMEWAMRQVAKWQAVTGEGIRGSLRDGLTATRIEWQQEGLKIEAFDAELAWQPLALARSTLRLDHLRASRLRIEDKRPPKPSVIPVSLGLPLRVEIGEVRLGRIEWVAAANSFEATDIAARYDFNLIRHEVHLANMGWAGGTYSGEATLGAHGEMPVTAKLQGRFETTVPGSTSKLPLTFDANLQGPITAFEASARLQGAAGTPTAPARATATARITPWEPQPVPQAQASFESIDLALLWPQAPHTMLSGKGAVKPAGTGTWVIEAQAGNSQPGPWDQHKLPVQDLKAKGEWRGGQAIVREFVARVGGGEVRGSGDWEGKDGWTLAAQLDHVNTAALHGAMAALPVGGKARVEGRGDRIGFDVALQAQGTTVKTARGATEAMLGALELKSATAKGSWQAGLLSLPSLDVEMTDAALRGSFEVRPATWSGSGRATLAAPGLLARVEGDLAQDKGAGTLRLASSNLAQALQWVGKWPGVPSQVFTPVARGRGEVQLQWQGGWRDPSVDGTASVASLEISKTTPTWFVREGTLSVKGRLADAQVQAHARAEQGQRRVNVDVAGRLGHRAVPRASGWQGQIATLNVSAVDPMLGTGTWTLALQRPVDWRYANDAAEVAAGEAHLKSPRDADAPAVVAWDPVRWRGGQLSTAGRITGLPLAWIDIVGGPQLAGSALSGDMVFDGQWDAQLGATPRIRASLARSRGDLTVLAETAQGQAARVRAGVREARITITGDGEAVSATLRWDSERGGTADGQLSTRLAQGGATGWHWPENAPLSGSLRAQLPRIGVWSVLAPPGWRLRGSLQADIKIAGTRAEPQLAGTIAADDLALRSVVDGIELQNGKLRAHFDGRRAIIDEFVLHGPGTNGGTVTATGEGSLTAQGPQARMTAKVDRLRASIRSDRQITVSGELEARRDAAATVVNGKLKVDQALIVLPEEGTPKLGDDVVVRGAAGPLTKAEGRAQDRAKQPANATLQLAVDVDLGNDLRVRGLGIDTHLRGTLAITGTSVTSPRIVGTIRAEGGEYTAYGQRLDIERGVIRFTGAADNPSLDILAIRPRLVQRVGVLVTGNALAPYVRLYAEPDLPDAEKLAWLVTGRAAPATGAESALVQQAALALLASRSGGNRRGIAASLGLDELSFRREGTGGPSVTLGKRFGQNFYAAYERSLAGALGTLFIFYDITTKVTLRAQTGERTAVDLIYTFQFD